MELMIVIAIVGILSAIATPAYLDYSVRAKLSEAILAVSPAKLAVTEYYQSTSTWPADRLEAGVDNINTKYVTRVVIVGKEGNAFIYIDIDETTTGVATATGKNNMYFEFVSSSVIDGSVDWECNVTTNPDAPGGASTIDIDVLAPANCRGNTS